MVIKRIQYRERSSGYMSSIHILVRQSTSVSVVIVLLLSLLVPVWCSRPAGAANFTMKTGYYLGSGTSKQITGLGFQPELIVIRASTAIGVSVFKSSVMPANTTAYYSATVDDTATNIAINLDGFTVGTMVNVNSVNVIYRWIAFAGSDCTATGYFCIGTYTGNGAANRTIATGFQPDMITVKRSTAVAAHFRTAAMAANRTEFFTTTAANTTGTYIANSTTTGFTIGTNDNAVGGVYYFMVFRGGGGTFAQGSYTGNAATARAITGAGFQPDAIVIKNSTSATANNRRSIFYTEKHFGDLASYFSDVVADTTTMVQGMIADGFTVGAGVNTNETGATVYWFAFGGASAMSGSGSFTMAQGTYTGTGVARSITGLGFSPDLVMVKNNAAQQGVFRTDQMRGDATAYFASATADFTGGITSLDADGFSLGTNATVNTAANTYQWQAFGGGYNPDTSSGAADFATGVYYGSGLTARAIADMPFQPDLVVVKRSGATTATFRTSSQTGDLSGYFAATAESAGIVQSLDVNGFTVGTNAATNTAAQQYRWFAFKSGTNFAVGNYTGTGVAGAQVPAPFWSDAIWIKRSTAVAGVQRPSTLLGDAGQYFLNTANATGLVTGINASGFTVGTNTATNANGGVYRYFAWRVPPTGALSVDVVDAGNVTVGSPSVSFTNVGLVFNCTQTTATLGVAAQKIRVTNMSANASWVLSLAPTNGPTALWNNGPLHYDFNDISGSQSGCGDGGDSDTYAGKLRVAPSGSTIASQSGCSTTNISKGTDLDYNQGATDSVSLMSGSVGSNTECYWDLTNVIMTQVIPAEQAPGSYTLGLTLTAVAQ